MHVKKKTLQLTFTLAIGLGIGLSFAQLPDTTHAVAAPIQNRSNPNESLAPLVEDLSPAVVNIDTETEVQGQLMPFFGMPYDIPDEYRKQQGQGSGFIISDDGYILTNYHVIEGADRVKVRTKDGETYDGTVVGTDDSTDIALIKIKSKKLPYVQLGDSDDMRVGDWVVAIGNPFGLGHTVTAGIISAKERIIGAGPYDAFIQTDASINPGNSGGPLFNLSGEVIAINTAINPRAQGIGFSVPINVVKSYLEDLKSDGAVQRGWLGVALSPMEDSELKSLKLEGGSIVRQIYSNTPAAEAGLKSGDVISHLNGTPVKDTDNLIRLVGQKRAGETISLTIIRKGKPKNISVKLGQRPSEASLSSGRFQFEQSNGIKLGIEVAEASGFDNQNPQRSGLVVLLVSKRGAAHGKLQPGDIVVKANGVPTRSGQTLVQILKEQPEVLKLRVFREGQYEMIDISF